MVECKYCDEEFDSETEMYLHWDEEHSDELNSHDRDKVKKAKRTRENEKKAKMEWRKKMMIRGIGGLVIVALIYLSAPAIANLFAAGNSVDFSQLNLENQPMLGQEDANVTIVEFGDYKCPFCRSFDQQAYPQLEEDYIDNGKAKIYFINFPFIGPDSTTAAVAGECVLKQDNEQFWNFHHSVYDNQGSERDRWATQEELMSIANESTENLDYEQLRSCISNQKTIDAVTSDKSLARQSQVTSTPTVFVNEQEVNPKYSSIKTAIEQQLR